MRRNNMHIDNELNMPAFSRIDNNACESEAVN